MCSLAHSLRILNMRVLKKWFPVKKVVVSSQKQVIIKL